MPIGQECKFVEITDENIGRLDLLVGESIRAGFGFLQKTIDEWNSGANRFDRPGEKLWGLFIGEELIGVGGLNIDPFAIVPGVGRVRHLYVREDRRREGFATLIMEKITKEAGFSFTLLRLYTDTAGAAAFYERLGFKRTDEYKASHFKVLPVRMPKEY